MDNILEKYERLVAFVRQISAVDTELKDPDELWKNAKTVQDGIDYADHFNAKIAIALLKEIGEIYD